MAARSVRIANAHRRDPVLDDLGCKSHLWWERPLIYIVNSFRVARDNLAVLQGVAVFFIGRLHQSANVHCQRRPNCLRARPWSVEG